MVQEKINAAFELMDKGFLEDALEMLSDLTVSKEDPAYYSYISTYGYIYTAKKDFQKALESYQKFLEKAMKEVDYSSQHIGHHQLAMVYREQGDYASAMVELEKERAVIEREFPEDTLIWSVHLYEVAYISHLLGDSNRAEELMEKSLNYALQTDDLIAQACSYRGLGEILSRLDLLVKSKKLFEEACDEIGAKEVEDLMASI